MNPIRPEKFYDELLQELRLLSREAEWVEFKHNNDNPEEIGQYISALSNSAALWGKTSAFMVWGVDDQTHEIIGTSFQPSMAKKGGQELESWLLLLLSPRINFSFHELQVDGKQVVILEIDAAVRNPVQFHSKEYIRIGSSKMELRQFPEKERALWRVFNRITFEQEIAAEGIDSNRIHYYLFCPAYFDLLNLPVQSDRGMLEAFENEGMLVRGVGNKWNITNLGALLFARNLAQFSSLKFKPCRVIHYDGNSRLKTRSEQAINQGYAIGLAPLIQTVTNMLPTNEIIGQVFRETVQMFPEPAIRELIANAIIHQDFYMTGTSPMIEIFSNRMEITNPGAPLVKTERFLDSPPKSRNEAMADMMRRLGICERRGSGIDKVVFQTELYQLPAPLFEAEDFTRVTLFAHKDFREMDREDKVRACYLHACLRYVDREVMTNTSLRNRFGIDERNSSTVSRIIKETARAGLVRPQDENAAPKLMKYIPFWA